MKRETFRVLFMLRRARTTKNGLAPILVRITTSGLKSEWNTQYHADPAKWNQSKERATGSDRLSVQLNSLLIDFRSKILDVRNQLQREGLEGNALQIKDRWQNPKHTSKMWLEELERYCTKRQAEVGSRITQLTANKYHRILRYLREYTQQRYGKQDISLGEISYEYIDGFNTFLQAQKSCQHNGAVNLLCCVKNFTFYCLRNEWIAKNPFANYKLKEQKVKGKDYLLKYEVELLAAKTMPNRRLEAVRDVFLFCCFTGLAFTDVDHLRCEHLSKDDHGKRWIHKPRQKTAVMSVVPLLPQAAELLDKHQSDQQCVATGKLLPVPSNQKMNAYLKEIATICNIDKTLTTHCARHSFACLAVGFGVPIDVVARVLGHTNTNMTRRYAKFSTDVIGREMNKLEEALLR